MRRTPRLLAVTLLGSLALAACGSSKAGSPSTADQGGGTPSATPASSEAPTVAPVTGHDVPAVTNATDLTKEPVLAAGKGAAPTTLQTKDLVVGTGPAATLADTVVVKYYGAIWATGKRFDASWGKGDQGYGQDAIQFSLGEVVPGFAQGIAGMKAGGRRVIAIPPDLGYGPGGNPGAGIKGTDTIVFVVDLVKIVS
jgi:peptidylprolyl isomerase